tara:strand:+ start:290 stop:859 length:570 start_codon:yes stop_codon:yes gene_type:complete
MIDCCKIKNTSKKCIRNSDKKVFTLPRKFTQKKCLKGPVKGFTMKSSCAPFKHCNKYTLKAGKNQKNQKNNKIQFLYNPNNPKKSFDVYINKNPSDTIPIKYTTINDVKNTIYKLEKLYKTNKYPHKRIWQVGMILKVRLEAMLKNKNKFYPKAKNVYQRYLLANKYFKFLGKRTKLDQIKRKKLKFTF